MSNSFLTTEATESRMMRPALVEMMSSSSLSSLTQTQRPQQRHHSERASHSEGQVDSHRDTVHALGLIHANLFIVCVCVHPMVSV